jgi:hypothetical protein
MSRNRIGSLLVLAALACVGTALAADTPPPPPKQTEISVQEYRIGETEVATIGKFRVALAKNWEETRDGKRVRVAWLSVVEKGSTAGQKDVELLAGDPLVLGDRTLVVSEVVLEAAGRPGYVVLKPK